MYHTNVLVYCMSGQVMFRLALPLLDIPKFVPLAIHFRAFKCCSLYSLYHMLYCTSLCTLCHFLNSFKTLSLTLLQRLR